MTFLKIISFPIRLGLFIIFAVLALIVSGLNHTFVMFLNFAAAVIAFFGSILSGLMIIGVISTVVIEITTHGNVKSVHDTIIFCLSSIGTALLFGIVCKFMPVISSVLFAAALTVSDWLLGFAKMILHCDVDELKYV